MREGELGGNSKLQKWADKELPKFERRRYVLMMSSNP